MDELTGLLDGPRAQGAFVLRVAMDPPWAVRVQDEAPLSLVAMARGHASAWFDGEAPVRLGPGDVAVIRGPDPYTFADDPATPPQAVIHPGPRCTTTDGRDLADAMALGVRTWGQGETGDTVMLVGTYELTGEVSHRLLDALPPRLVLPADAWDSRLVALLGDEIVRDAPGQEAVLDRLLDLVLVAVVRAWFARPDAGAPSWYRAYDDPVVGRALRLIHHNPGEAWTVASLAAASGVSRAALADGSPSSSANPH